MSTALVVGGRLDPTKCTCTPAKVTRYRKRISGPHLHFELHYKGGSVNPWTVLPPP